MISVPGKALADRPIALSCRMRLVLRTSGRRLLLGSIVIALFLIHADRAHAVGWVTPSGNTDGTGWTFGANARDGSTSTYASHAPASGWGGWETFTLPDSIWSDRFRVLTDFGYGEVDQVQVDVSADGVSWTTAFVGSVADAAWDTENFTAQQVRYARFRYHRIATNYVFWLYEFNVYETPLTIDLPTVSTTPATSIETTSAIVHGLLDDSGGVPCDVRLQYGLTAAYEIGDTPWISGYDTGSTFGVLLSGLGQGQTYHFRAQARNDAGTASGADDVFTCAPHSIGWVSPSSSSDPTGNWLGTDLAHDDESTTHAHCVHLINDPDGQWSPYLYLTHSLVNVDSLRFLAKDDVNIDSAEIDLSPDGTSWNNVFGSAFLDQTWTAVGFPDQNANQARVRFHLSTNAVGMHWELGELDFHVSRILSVTVSNAVFGFGTQLLDTWLSPDSTVVTNDSAEIENLDVRLSQFQSGADSWTISPVTNGANQVRAQWSAVSSSGPWTDIAAYDTDFTIGTNVAPSSSITLFVRIQTPTSTDSHEEYSSSLTVTAW